MSNQIFPTLPGFDIAVKRTPLYATGIQAATSGKELRASWWAFPKWQYDLTLNFVRQAGFSAQTLIEEAGTLVTFHAQHRGRWDSFLFSDPYDSSDTGMGFGVGDGVTTVFQLQRREPGVYTNVLGTFPVPTTPRTNLFLQAQTFTISWTALGGTPSLAATVAPDGTPTGNLFTEDTSTGNHGIRQGITQVSGLPYTVSIFAKAGTRSRLCLDQYTGSADILSIFDLSAGTVISGTGTITALGNGWFRCSQTVIATTTGANAFALSAYLVSSGSIVSYTGTSGTLYLWGAQLEASATPTDYIPTVAAAVTATPSYYPGTDGFEPITEPAPGTIIYKNGVALVQGTDWTRGASGMVTFAVAPAAGAVLTWTGGYYRRVRFDDDSLTLERIVNLAWKGGSIRLVSTK